MSSIKTKDKNGWAFNGDSSEDSDISTDIEKTEESEELDETQKHANSVYTKTVINVGVVGTKKSPVIRLDYLEFEEKGGRYTSQAYDLTMKHGTLGLFTLLDDYFARRFKLFHSSKSVQAFMLALNDIESEFVKKTKNNLYDYCSAVVGKAAEIAKENGITGKSGSFPLMVGYGISEEVEVYRLSKHLVIEHNPIGLNEIGLKFVELFNKYENEIKEKKYCSALINNHDDGMKSFFIDPVVHLPVISYHPLFTEAMSRVCSLIILNSESAIETEIDEVTITSLILMPTATVNSLLSICNENGLIKKGTDIGELPFVIGEYFKKTYDREMVNGGNISSVVGYS